MNLSSFRFFTVALMFVLAAVLSGCSGKKTCSADTQCKDGSYCNDGKCTEFKEGDYKIIFESPSDKATITSAQDLDLSVEGIQIDVKVAMEDAQNYINDGMSVILSIKKGENEVLLTGKFLKNKAVFSQITLPEGEVTLSAYLEQNPGVKTTVTVNSVKMDVTMYYLKGGAEGTKTLLESSIITDEDDSDGNLENGIQLNLVAETAGIKEGDIVNLFFPQISEDNKAGEGNVDANGLVVFENITVPVLANVTMTIVSGEYSENVEFEVSSKIFCGFLLNIEDDTIFGKKDDRNDTLSGLQYDLVISEITGCGKGSNVSIFIDSDETGTPWTIFTISSNQVEERITLQKSTSSEDKRSVLVVVEDEPKNMKGKKTAEGIIVDLDDPSVDISFPQVGAELNMSDDIDAGTPGLQINFAGEASDALTGPVSVEIKLGETVITTLEDINGDFESLYTFPQSLPTAVLTVTVFDEAGNSSDAVIPFTVNIDPEIEFYSVCGHTGADIIDSMWLNLSDDADENADLLQCKVVIKIGDGTGATHVSLKTGFGEDVKKEIESDNTAEFDISLEDSVAGIKLNAKSYIEESVTGENNLTVRVDTEPPVVTMNNSLLLGNGGTTGSENITFEYNCASDYMCTFNALLDDETSTAFVTDTERVLSGLSTGPHSFKVKARDAAGNEGAQTVFNWTVDSVKPETTITSDPGAGTENDFALFTFTTTKPGAGSTFWCKLEKGGSPLIPEDGSFEECVTGKRDYYGLSDGEYRFLVKAEDSVGNEDSSPAEHEWIVGSTAPVTTIDTVVPADAITNVNEIAFTYSASVASTFECRLEKDGVVVEDWAACNSGTTAYSSLTDGSYLFMVQATAVYGTKEQCPATYTWIVDTVLPKIRILSKPGKLTPYNAGTILFECTGEADECAFTCEFDSASVDCATGYYSFAGIDESLHRFTVTATDKAGNVSEVVASDADVYQNDYSWTVNALALGVIITSKPATVTDSTDAAFAFESNKAAAFECKIDEEDYAPCSTPQNYTGFEDGSHTFTVKATFVEEIAFASYTWTIDASAPAVSIDSGPANPTNRTGAVIYFSADETATFECKLSTETEWSKCTSPKIYPSGAFGASGTTQSYTFEVRAKDGAGNTGSASHSWVVDLEVPSISWISPVPGTDGKITVGKADNVFGNDAVNYAIKITVSVTGSNIGKPINVQGFKTPPGYTIVNVDTPSPKNYELTVGLQNGARVNNPLTISVADDTGNSASVSRVVIVNTEMPTITWASPANNYKFISTTTAPSFTFNVWNALPGTTVELVDLDTSNIVGTAVTAGASGIQEYVTVTPTLSDRCNPYKFYATFLDTGENIRYYTNSTSDVALKTSRNFTVDRTAAAIGDITIPGVSDTDRILNRADNLNANPDGGMKTDITVDISDAGNAADANRTVKVFTNNGAGEPSSLLATLNAQGDTAEFKNVTLSENVHTLKIEVTDCSGNIVSVTLPAITVDTVIPELTVSAPRGSASNWRWLTAADDTALGTITGGNFTEIDMTVDSNEILGSYIEVIHTSYDYSDTQNYQNDISTSAVIGTNSVTVSLPDLEYAKHRFTVTVEDAAGNLATAGDGSNELYEVDVIVPQIAFNDINDGDEFDTDMDPAVPGFQIVVKLDVVDVLPQSGYVLKAVPVLSQGGGVDSSRIEKEWTGTAAVDGTINRSIALGNGWWRLSATIKDNHDNQSSTPQIDINAVVSDPSITLKKSYNHALGAGPVIQGVSVEASAWMVPSDVDCTGDNCDTEIEVWTDAPAGSTAYVSINGGAEVSKTTVSNSGQSYANFDITLDNSIAYNTIEVRLVSTTLAESDSTDYIKIDETLPQLTLINPATCTGICRRKDLSDDPVTTDLIELAELGYGYDDDAVAGGVLNFKTAGAIQFTVEGAAGGTVAIETVSGITNGTASISYDSIGGYYYADFTTLTATDSNADGQTDYDLVFKVTEQPSGAVSRYLVKLHVYLNKPAAVDISGKVSTYKKEGRVEMNWNAVAGNNSTSGDLPGAVYRYDVRYQDYNTASCTIGTTFTSAKKPIETAGPVPDPVLAGEMGYEFFVNRLDNGKLTTDPLYREFDTHKNGNKYCFAAAAVDAVYASDGTVLAENLGNIVPNDTGEMKMEWTSIISANPQEHLAIIRNLGDLDGDGLDDFVVADGYRSSDGTTDDYAGQIEIIFSAGEMTFVKNGEAWQSIGQGVSNKADFNGDGFLDFAYTDYYGDVFIHYGSETGLNATVDVTFTAKDNGEDVFRTMATGDYNGDGCDDIAVSAPGVGGSGVARGQVYIYFGRGESCSSEEAIAGSTPDVTFEGAVNSDRLGRAEIYAVGDLNGDGKTDFAFPTDTKIFIAYGGDSGGAVSAYDLTGFKSVVGLRIGYGNFNGDTYFDLVVADNNKINIYYGGTAGIVATPDITISDISTVNFNYPPSVTNFAKTVSNQMVDINGDGLTDLITVSERGLLIYETHQGTLSAMPSVFDPFVNSTSSYIKVLMLDYGVVYCDNATNKGSCHILNYGE
ncbi:MAG: hypothetical protein RBT87_09220 [bacterium]|jgi:hypothetical protein|nr:hypothetical protein [bacterium]